MLVVMPAFLTRGLAMANEGAKKRLIRNAEVMKRYRAIILGINVRPWTHPNRIPIF